MPHFHAARLLFLCFHAHTAVSKQKQAQLIHGGRSFKDSFIASDEVFHFSLGVVTGHGWYRCMPIACLLILIYACISL